MRGSGAQDPGLSQSVRHSMEARDDMQRVGRTAQESCREKRREVAGLGIWGDVPSLLLQASSMPL